MIVSLTFAGSDALKPRLFINLGGKSAEIARTRWVQFIALLVYRRLTGLENGWVTLDDVGRLLAFQKSKPKVIGKYLNSSSVEFPPVIAQFFSKFLDIPTTGPYSMLLDPELIETEIPCLEKYLRWITAPAPREKTDLVSLWHIAQQAYRNHAYASYQNLLQAYIRAASNDRHVPQFTLPFAYIRLADTEFICRSNVIDVRNSLENARRLILELKPDAWKNILLADSLDIEAINLNRRETPFNKFMNLNIQSL